MSFEQVRYFVAVAEERQVVRAARRLRMAQPALSRQIKNLEVELGTLLFVRTPRGMCLSESGDRFLAHARAILELVDSARSATHERTGAHRP